MTLPDERFVIVEVTNGDVCIHSDPMSLDEVDRCDLADEMVCELVPIECADKLRESRSSLLELCHLMAGAIPNFDNEGWKNVRAAIRAAEEAEDE